MAAGSPGGTSRPASLTTSGSAPPVVATVGTPQAIASAAGRPNPSNSDGTTATAAEP